MAAYAVPQLFDLGVAARKLVVGGEDAVCDLVEFIKQHFAQLVGDRVRVDCRGSNVVK